MRGISLRALFRNLLFPFRFAAAYLKSRRLIKKLSPVAVIGTGGYASGLPLLAAIHKGIPTVIHEQNSYPGITTRWLSSRVTRVCLSYEDARRHLKKKVVSSPVTLLGRRL
jgi:UDP-N-acetylglucosamine--N-acetylmuramyl-(pentapeptide) pyrophosphoryl-undecaprenol N-acetylglucosamine transferase